MKLDELRTVQSKERRKDSLQQLRDSFYRDVAAYIQDLKATRDRRAEQVDDPFSDNEVRRLSDELETAEEVAEAVYERRVGKVVKLASFAAADMPVDDEGMTSEERELFDDLVARITQNKQAVLDVLSGTAEPADTAGSASTAAGPTNPVDAASQKTAPSTDQPAGSATREPTSPEPTNPAPDAHAESTPAESDSVLAEAMGAKSSDHSTATDTGADTEGESTEPATPREIPPSEAEPEPDAVLGTSTDGGTTTEPTAERTHDSEPSNPAAPTADGTTEPAESGGAGDPAGGTESVDPTNPAGGTESADVSKSAGDDSERTTLRITKNVGEIFGVDGREYTLRSEDVVTLPTANAEPLVERDAALQLD